MHVDDSSLFLFLNKELNLNIKVSHRKTRPHMVKWAITQKKILLEKIIPLFDKYPMLTEKRVDYIFFVII